MSSTEDLRQRTAADYAALRREVLEGNPGLDADQQRALRSHYPVMNDPARYPPALVSEIYVRRRTPAMVAVATTEGPLVFDAGCGYGSESYFFAALGARVLAVDLEAEKIEIARRRQPYWEEHFGRPLDIVWEAADLDHYVPTLDGISLTWMGSVLAAIPNQDGFFQRVYDATRPGGEMMISDMNLLNPLFLLKEWRRRNLGRRRSSEFDAAASFGGMFWRRQRQGARYFPIDAAEGESIEPNPILGPRELETVSPGAFDDSQFFWSRTLAQLFRRTGFEPGPPHFSGFVPPIPGLPGQRALEALLSHVPVLRRMGYFYRMSGVKPAQGVPG